MITWQRLTTTRTVLFGLLACTLVVGASVAVSPAASAAPGTTWLCEPGRAGDPCGGRSGAPIDCFYVYPTVSLQLSSNSDLSVGPEEQAVARQQAEPFGAQCNVWSPMYRQSTLLGLATAPGAARTAALDTAYDDIQAAWDDYIAQHNDGRGVVLIGHSQGTAMLRTLIRNRIDGQHVQDRLVSAILLGGNVLVRKGMSLGGDFGSVPACTAARQNGCVVAYSAFGTVPPPDSRYGFAPTQPNTSGTRGRLPFGPDYEVLCTNPAALSGNAKAEVHGIVGGRAVDGYSAECTTGAGPHVLMITGGGTPGVPPAATLPTVPNATWGLHMLDLNIAQHDLVDLVATQSQSYASAHR